MFIQPDGYSQKEKGNRSDVGSPVKILVIAIVLYFSDFLSDFPFPKLGGRRKKKKYMATASRV